MLRIVLPFLVLTLLACDSAGPPAERVQLTLYTMSRCQFASEALRELLPVLGALGDRVDVELGFIASQRGNELGSMYGAADLEEDRLQLCALEHGGAAGWRKLLSCQFEDAERMPAGWQACSAREGLDTRRVAQCFEGAEGWELLRASVARSETAGVTTSPTLHIAGAPFVQGRHAWFYARALCERFGANAPDYCAKLPAPVDVAVTIVSDARCQKPECRTERMTRFVAENIPGASVQTLDWQRPEARALFRSAGAGHLPFAVFSPSIAKEPRAFSALQHAGLTALPTGDGFVLPVGTTWQPDQG